MGLFRRRPATPEPAAEERAWLLPGGLYAPSSVYSGPSAGESVTMTSALRSAAVWACQRVLVSTISMLPVDVNRTVDGRKVPVPPSRMVTSPSAMVSRRGWVAQCIRSNLGAGNIYGRVVDVDSVGRPLQVETIAPSTVTWQCDDGAEVPYVNGAKQTIWPLGDFWHVPASQFLMPGSRIAMSPVDFASTSVGTGLAAERFGSSWFEAGVHPSSLYYVDAPGLTPEQAANIKERIMVTQRTGEPSVMGNDIRREEIKSTLSDSQFIDLLRFEVEQACRFWGVPPSMVYAAVSGQNITYANISQNDITYLKYSVEGWIVDLEDAWSDLLAIPHSVKFNVDALLRMDAQGRADLAAKRLAAKTTTVNAVRALEDEPAFDDPIYDMPGIPGGTQPVGQMVKELTPGVGVLITADEGRAILNEQGAELAIPGPSDLGPAAPAAQGKLDLEQGGTNAGI